MSRILVIGLLGLIPAVLRSQETGKHALKCDFSAFLRNGYGFAYEYRANSKISLELKTHFERHEATSEGIFNGDWNNYYSERRTDTLHQYTNKLVGSSGWYYITDGRPLPAVEPFVAKSTLQMSLGVRFTFEKKRSRWRIWLQPGISATNHHYFEISDNLEVEHSIEDNWVIGAYPFQSKVRRRTLAIHQKRSMRLKNKWFCALGYDLGVTRKFGEHLFVEGRIAAGANFWVPYEESPLPTLAQRFWVRPAVTAGWTF